ncbi:DNA mismatch repair endonuclease MutL [Anaerofilum sp. BX8]|uniref:DNA mismatch repair protein MutL n=1 Tax=Anaerofilum hominis TaxID=2763016 RepID=A0A923I467_9FIRM|nr:DNA mismatch repair endonuclease MutL [Anaerofilum hominis]MBC5580015.1 DNA mismatch repair endonuclease MutL [Anaerofilum hominis]
MAVIHVLDKHTAELIAAGEVVERPASVVKELIENSIDAGSTAVTVAIVRGGVGSIEVSDNGSGIEAEYISTAFVRHATSKIAREEDLAAIGTLGFRGEALASIAAVAKVDLLTRTEADEYACLYRQAGGEELSAEAAARPVGTTITVRDLFYNVPARMKFLKKDTSEGNYVSDVVLRQALAHPEISFRFVRDGREQFHTPGDGDAMSAIYAVLSREFAKNLMQVSYRQGVLGVEGYVTAPIACRGSRSMQFFYINGRQVEDRTLMAALETAYKGMAMQGRFPGCVLNVTMPLERVDVNVHPAKTEVRFANTGEIFDLMYKAVKSTVSRPDAPQKRLDLSRAEGAAPAAPASAAPAPAEGKSAASAGRGPSLAAQLEMPGAARPLRPAPAQAPEGEETGELLRQTAAVTYETRRTARLLDIEKTPQEDFAAGAGSKASPESRSSGLRDSVPAAAVPAHTAAAVPAPETTENELESAAEPLEYVGEAFRTYILAQYGDELVLIDKHAAHERVLYERLAAGYGRVDGQLLMSPVSVTLSAAEKNALLADDELLTQAGFEVEDFGGASVLVRAVPANVPVESVERLTEEIAAKLASGSRDTRSEKTDWVLHSIACRAAIKAGDHDPAPTLLALAKKILDGEVPPFCPHGRPVLIRLSRKELEKQFGRRE